MPSALNNPLTCFTRAPCCQTWSSDQLQYAQLIIIIIRFRVGTRQRNWTRPVVWDLIPMTALWAGEGRAQLSQHTAQVGRINRLDRYACSPGHRAYCCAELDISSLAMALTTTSTHFTIPQKVYRRLSRPSWLAPYCRQSSETHYQLRHATNHSSSPNKKNYKTTTTNYKTWLRFDKFYADIVHFTNV